MPLWATATPVMLPPGRRIRNRPSEAKVYEVYAVSPLLPPLQVPTRIAGTLPWMTGRGRGDGIERGVVRRVGVVVRMADVSVDRESAVGVDVTRLPAGT